MFLSLYVKIELTLMTLKSMIVSGLWLSEQLVLLCR